ncbi:PREDICTED: subtilisin-like protease Glyma18g48580 [Erythranthe guttata]|uniref:subtilisin-like protease Glyma18g48580 n=1 Tax=Erythranthe guttata TaxID=4155 RepID=UPI00064D9E0C|nr:PREDICTED: subtilisin-like protease Glyma18g48580 [Erythranthe guttata]|eukprot:XP_012848489.1 PREDICTED: subtilisin-like protease Glyma18g48580 [Erythranthe guttata]
MKSHFIAIVFCLALLVKINVSSASSELPKVYIVYLGEHAGDKTFQEIEDVHHSYLHSVKGSREEAKACVVYSYKNVINGFSAVLTPDEAHQISSSAICMKHMHETYIIYRKIYS